MLNDPIFHDSHQPPMPTKFPLDIPKFEGNPIKDPGDHVTTFNLWFSFNSLKDDSIQLCLFQCNLIRGAVKWQNTCHLDLSRGNRYIIVVVQYFTKWVGAMVTFSNDGETNALFIFNQIVARFNISKEIFTYHGGHFQNKMMHELTSKLGFKKEHLSPYYPQTNDQVEAINKSLKTILH